MPPRRRGNGGIYARGLYIEREPYEALVLQAAGILACAIAGRGRRPERKLVIYVESDSNEALRGLLRHLRQSLPPTHWPDKIVRVPRLPRSQDGSVSLTTVTNGAIPKTRRPYRRPSVPIQKLETATNAVEFEGTVTDLPQARTRYSGRRRRLTVAHVIPGQPRVGSSFICLPGLLEGIQPGDSVLVRARVAARRNRTDTVWLEATEVIRK